MSAVKRILAVIDPDKKEQPAFSRALCFDNGQPLEIILLSCLCYPSIESTYILDPENITQVKDAMIKQHHNKMLTLVHECKLKAAKIELEVIWRDSVHIGILEMVEQYQPDLLIKSTHKHSAVTRWFFNSVDKQLLRACPTPLLFVKQHEWPENATIMAAIDPGHRLNKQGELDKRILTLAHGIAQQLNLPLHACHCFDPSYWEILFKAVGVAEIWTDVFPANPDVNDHRVLDDLRELHSKKFNQDCQDTVPNSENRHLIEGSVDEVIPTLVLEQKVAIVVLSTEHRTGLLESTAEDILEAVECDVLAIKPAGFESPFTDRLR